MDLGRILTTACAGRNNPWAYTALVRTHGSTYRKSGPRLPDAPDGKTAGTLRGGRLEEKITNRGIEVMYKADLELLNYDARRLFGCDGRLNMFNERIDAEEVMVNSMTDVADRIDRRQICLAETQFGRDLVSLERPLPRGLRYIGHLGSKMQQREMLSHEYTRTGRAV